MSPGPAHYRLPHKKIRGGRLSESVIPGQLELLQRAAAAGPGKRSLEKRMRLECVIDIGTQGLRIADRTWVNLTGPGQYELQTRLPDGGRFNKHRSKTVFELETIPMRDIPGPGTYENFRQVLR